MSTEKCKFVQPNAWMGDENFEEIVKFARTMSQMCEFADEKKAAQIKKVINTFLKINAVLYHLLNRHSQGG